MLFRLEPHHLPSDSTVPLDAPADAVFSLLWKGSERQIMLRWVRWKPSVFLLFLRVDGELGIAAQGGYSYLEVPMKWRFPRRSPEKLLRIARRVERSDVLHLGYPPFHGASEEPHLVMRQHTGRGVWLDSSLSTVGEFDLSLPLDNYETTWDAAFFAEFENKLSHAYFAWHWARMNQEERYTWFYDGPDGLKAQEHLVRLVLQSTDELWMQHALVSWGRGFNRWGGWFYDEERRWMHEQQLPPRLKEWCRFINSHIGQSQWKAASNQSFVRRWLFRKQKMRSFRVEVPLPTAHERLEARLELRDWLEQNVSPQRRRWLLPP